MSQVQVLLVDDCKQWREKLRSMIEVVPGYQVVAEASDGIEAVQKAAQLYPEIVLLDIGMPIMNGIEAAPIIRRASPLSKIVFVTQENDHDLRSAALATGAEGYCLKSRVISDLMPALNALGEAACATTGVLFSSNGHDVRILSLD